MKYKKIDFEKVGENIRRERNIQRLSAEGLGAKCGLTRATINNIETNAEKALFRNIDKVSKALGVRLENILY